MSRKVHIASQTYQRNWAVNEKIMCAPVGTNDFKSRSIENVGWRSRWWGQDSKLAEAVENELGRVEGKATDFLRDPSGHWPVTGELRAYVAGFLSLHIARSPAFRAWFDETMYERVAAAINANPSSERAQMAAGRHLRTGRERATVVLEYTTSLASLLASMHWSLVHFDGRVLALSDQPVSVVPAGIEERDMPLHVVPRTGLVDTLEVRAPVAPDRALVLTWQDGPESALGQLGTFEHLTSLNACVAAQADTQWFRHPDGTAVTRRPPALDAVIDPIAPSILRGYDSRAARASVRRMHAARMAHQIAERRQVGGMVGWVSHEPEQPAG